MRSMLRSLLFLYAVNVLIAIDSTIFAAPLKMTYSGRLTETSGKPVSGPIDLKLVFYNSSNSDQVKGNPYFFNEVILVDGMFSVTIAFAGSDANFVLDSDTETWIQVEDLTNSRVYPRQRFDSVPYAFRVPTDKTTLKFNESGNLQVVGFSGSVLPSATPTKGDVLQWSDSGWVWTAFPITNEQSVGNGTGKTEIDLATEVSGILPSGNLPTNVSKLGNTIELATETTGSLPINRGGTGAVTAIGARSLLGLGDLATLSKVSTGEITDNSITNADINNTAAIVDTKLETISTAGKVADSALSVNITKLGTNISLDSSETTGVLPVVKGGTGAVTAAAARTSLGMGSLATLSNVGTVEVTNGSIKLEDLNQTMCSANEIIKMNSTGTALICAKKSHVGAIYRWQIFSTYDEAFGWMANNNAAVFGGVAPSTWTDSNGVAASITDVGVLRDLVTQKGYGGKNALVVADTWYSYSSTNGTMAIAVFRIKNTTANGIVWTAKTFQTSYSEWGEKASVALNGSSIWDSGGNNYGATTGHTHFMTIPASSTSTVIFVSGSSSPSGSSRTCMLAFYNDSLDLPAGLEFVDDLDTATALNE